MHGSKSLVVLKNVDVTKIGVIWKPNRKAEMTSNIFENWLHDLDKKMT